MSKRNYELTEGEWAIIGAVWDNEPCAAPTVQEALEKQKNWSYSTVKTIRNLILYRSAITKQEAQNGEIMRAVKRAFDGAFTPMMQFLLDNNSLSKRQLSELEAMIKSKKGKSKSKKARTS